MIDCLVKDSEDVLVVVEEGMVYLREKDDEGALIEYSPMRARVAAAMLLAAADRAEGIEAGDAAG